MKPRHLQHLFPVHAAVEQCARDTETCFLASLLATFLASFINSLCKALHNAFRVTKGTLETRPIFHFTERRIEAHVCLCFIAYKVYKELERIVHQIKLGMSIDSVLKIAKTITTIRLRLPLNDKIIYKTMLLTPAQQSLKPLFDYLGV